MPLHDWADIPVEQLNPQMTRQVIHGDNITMAQLSLKKGSVVPLHHHVNEQITVVSSGRLTFFYPEETVEVSTGQVLRTPPNVPHKVEALEDTIAIDIFAPVRQDWIDGDDAYLRR